MPDLPAGSITLCMIARDEEDHLAWCLDSVRGVVDEIVVVDTGSQDRTAELAADLGARVLFHDARDRATGDVDLAAARNHGLSHARGSFVLVLDADETLDPTSAASVRTLARAGGDVGYVVERRNHVPESLQVAWVDHAVRLFPNRPAHRYRHRIHETVDASILAAGGRLATSPVVVDHHLPAEPERRRKSARRVELLLEDLARNPDDAERLTFLAAEYHQLGRFDEAAATAERVCALAPDDSGARVVLALYHWAFQANAGAARQDLAVALSLRPGDPEVIALLECLDESRLS